jgi:hypothetical protein
MSDELRRLLRGVPADEPGPHFTAGVLARLERPAGGRRRGLGQLPAWAAAVAIVVALSAGWAVIATRAAAQERRKAELVRESAAIAAELRELRQEATRPAPMLYIAGNEEVDVVLDLSSLPVAATARAYGRASGG